MSSAMPFAPFEVSSFGLYVKKAIWHKNHPFLQIFATTVVFSTLKGLHIESIGPCDLEMTHQHGALSSPAAHDRKDLQLMAEGVFVRHYIINNRF